MFLKRGPNAIFALLLLAAWGWPVLAQPIEFISQRDFDEYVAWLMLDEEQESAAREMYANYQAQIKPELGNAARAFHAKQPQLHQPGSDVAYAKHTEERAELAAAIDQLDQALFENLRHLLGPEQQEIFRRIPAARQRQMYRTDRGELPEGNVDLAWTVLQLDLSLDERAAIHRVLDWYEPALIQALQGSAEASREYYPLFHEWKSAREPLLSPRSREELTAEERQARQQRVDELHEGMADILRRPGERLVALNRQGLRALLDVLDKESRAQLRQSYLEQSYPEVYPDPAHAGPLYDAALELEDLTDGQAAQVSAMLDAYERAHELLSTELAEAFMVRRRASRSGGSGPEAMRDLQFEVIFEPGLEREALNAAQIDRLKAVLTPEQIGLLPEWDFAENPPERPWDWGNRIREAEAHERRSQERMRDLGIIR